MNKTGFNMNRSISKGFTLIELMIVIAIIGILAMIVTPGYRSYVLEGHRNNAQGVLLEIMRLQIDFYRDNRKYTTDLTDLDFGADPHILTYSGNAGFKIEARTCLEGPPLYPDITDADAAINRCFRLIATPTGDQVNDGGLVIDNRGRKIHDYASEYIRDWYENDAPAANCPECSDFPDVEQ